MSDEYTLHSNFQRFSDDPRAQGEYEYRMARVREREAERDELAVRGACALPAESETETA